jgi:hypothetical protein
MIWSISFIICKPSQLEVDALPAKLQAAGGNAPAVVAKP